MTPCQFALSVKLAEQAVAHNSALKRHVFMVGRLFSRCHDFWHFFVSCARQNFRLVAVCPIMILNWVQLVKPPVQRALINVRFSPPARRYKINTCKTTAYMHQLAVHVLHLHAYVKLIPVVAASG
jgi:hypothetical protein